MSANILAIDAATEACSVALQFNDHCYSLFEICPQQHSQRILPMVDEVLKQAGIRLSELDALAFSQGPGSFTGVRIGVGVAQGLAFGADLPLIGVSTLQTMAQRAITKHGSKKVIAAIDARMGEIYTAQFEDRDGLAVFVGNETVIKPDDADFGLVAGEPHEHCQIAGVGTGWQTYATQLAEKVDAVVLTDILYPHAQDMLPLAIQALADNRQVEAQDAQPVYVRDTVTWKKLPGR
ncbi:MAG: tRNA threonylcarbamoyladenosine biosynthesis protein TsaB [Alteromonadaceae bacterium]|jgi:tRNA threonylcarbamoyladenosine biosynthesis protein TsaB